MAHCDEYTALISAALDGALSPEEAQRLAEHLAGCPECRELFGQLAVLQGTLAELSPTPVPEGLTDRILAGLAADKVVPFVAPVSVKRPARPWRRWGATAAVLAVVVAGAWGLSGRRGGSLSGARENAQDASSGLYNSITNVAPAAGLEPASAEGGEVRTFSGAKEEAYATYSAGGEAAAEDADILFIQSDCRTDAPTEAALDPEEAPAEDRGGDRSSSKIANGRSAPLPSFAPEAVPVSLSEGDGADSADYEISDEAAEPNEDVLPMLTFYPDPFQNSEEEGTLETSLVTGSHVPAHRMAIDLCAAWLYPQADLSAAVADEHQQMVTLPLADGSQVLFLCDTASEDGQYLVVCEPGDYASQYWVDLHTGAVVPALPEGETSVPEADPSAEEALPTEEAF